MSEVSFPPWTNIPIGSSGNMHPAVLPLVPSMGDSLFRGMVANAVELRFPAELFERRSVVLVCSHVSVVYCEGHGTTVDQDVL